MSQTQTPTEPKATCMLRAFCKDQDKIDALIPELEKERGGNWSRAHVIELAMEALTERRLKPSPEAP